jgi:periplasmic protein TonB
METQQQQIRSWDDLIFENRNQAYGAYAMRQGYTNGLFKSVIAAASLLGVIILSSNSPTGKDLPPFTSQDSTELTPKVFEVKPDAIKPPIQKVTPPPVNPGDLLERVVQHDPVDNPAPKPDSTTTTSFSSNPHDGDGSVDGVDDGTTSSAGENYGADSLATSTNKTHDFVEVMPVYPGGYKALMEYISKNTRYPSSSQRVGNQGTVHVQFVIDASGAVTDVKVIRGVDAACDKEAARVISKMKPWHAGNQNKRAVKVRMVLPIKFKLND